MKALQYQIGDSPLSLNHIHIEPPNGDEVVLEMCCAALNHRDLWICQGLYPNLQNLVTLGSDGVGSIDQQGFMVNPNINWGSNPSLPSEAYQILGMPGHGSFCEQMIVPKDRLVPVPAHLTFEQAAAIPLAGLTAYRLLFTRCGLQKGERVCISGIGGGVALFAMQFALAAGAEVWVTSSRLEKIQKAVDHGASGGVLYTKDNWHKKLKEDSGGFDLIIDSAGGDGFSNLIKTANTGARVGIYGGSTGHIQNLSPQIIFWKHLNIYGSSMGSDQDFRNMVDFITNYSLVPIVDSIFEFEDFQKAFDRMKSADQFGKIVLRITNSN